MIKLLQYYPFWIYLTLNVAVLFLRRPLGWVAVLYVLSVVILFTTYILDWQTLWPIFLLHGGITAWAVIKEKRWILVPFSLWNLFLIMPFLHYGPLELSWYFEESQQAWQSLLMDEVESFCAIFIVFVFIPVMVVKGIVFLVRSRETARMG